MDKNMVFDKKKGSDITLNLSSLPYLGNPGLIGEPPS